MLSVEGVRRATAKKNFQREVCRDKLARLLLKGQNSKLTADDGSEHGRTA